MPSSEIRKVPWDNYASVGEVSGKVRDLRPRSRAKAGRTRDKGRRPVVRGTAMNPRDHKYGGGEGRSKRGTKQPKDVYGNVTGGRKTRKKHKASDKHILKRRVTKKRK